MPTVLLRLPEVTRRTGLSRSRLYAQMRAGEFPAPAKIGQRAVAWSSEDIERWIADRLETRGQ
ncbi:MAG: AlpA family phage regulatory protein [Sphingomonadaceae bacterium]